MKTSKMGAVILGIGVAAVSVMPAFAQTSSSTSLVNMDMPAATTTTSAHEGLGMREKRAGTVASNASTTAERIACVGAAVNARETTLDTAESTYTQAVTSAYTTRASALQAAYALTDVTSLKAAVKSAWSTFSASIKSARSTWSTDRTGAWKTFRTAAAACKAPAGTSDSTYSTATAN